MGIMCCRRSKSIVWRLPFRSLKRYNFYEWWTNESPLWRDYNMPENSHFHPGAMYSRQNSCNPPPGTELSKVQWLRWTWDPWKSHKKNLHWILWHDVPKEVSDECINIKLYDKAAFPGCGVVILSVFRKWSARRTWGCSSKHQTLSNFFSLGIVFSLPIV